MGAVVTFHNARSYQILSAGAEEVRARVVYNIRAKAAETVVPAAQFDNSATSQSPVMSNRRSINVVFNTLDSEM